jgi:hypothetical protein
VAYFQAHFPRAFWPIMNGGEPAVLFCFAFLYFFAAGAGPFSLDSLFRRKTAHGSDSPAGEDVSRDRADTRPKRSHAA